MLTAMGMATNISVSAAPATTYFEPFDVARRFATLDLMSADGRPGTSSPR